jgi:hypothetical protein
MHDRERTSLATRRTALKAGLAFAAAPLTAQAQPTPARHEVLDFTTGADIATLQQNA